MAERAHSGNSTLLVRGLAIGLIGVGICLALLSLLSPESENQLSGLIDGPFFWQAVILQLFALGLFVLAWRTLFISGDLPAICFVEATAHIGITLLGKYIPGKIWGLLGRTYLLKQRGYTSTAAVNFLLADQILTFYTGLAIGGLAIIALYDGLLFSLILPVICIMSAALVAYYGTLSAWLLEKLGRLFQRVKILRESTQLSSTAINKISLAGSMFVYAIHWVSISLVLLLLFYPWLESELLFNAQLLIAAIPLAMLSGFVAVWAPGGIGVREGIIVGILVLNLPFELAASIAVTYRMICVLNDLTTGAVALVYFGSAGIESIQNDKQDLA